MKPASTRHSPRNSSLSSWRVKIDGVKAAEWIKKGAQPTERVARFLSQITLEGESAPIYAWSAGSNPNKGEPGKKAQERAKERAEKAEAAAEAAKAPAPVEETPAEDAPAEEAVSE